MPDAKLVDPGALDNTKDITERNVLVSSSLRLPKFIMPFLEETSSDYMSPDTKAPNSCSPSLHHHDP